MWMSHRFVYTLVCLFYVSKVKGCKGCKLTSWLTHQTRICFYWLQSMFFFGNLTFKQHKDYMWKIIFAPGLKREEKLWYIKPAFFLILRRWKRCWFQKEVRLYGCLWDISFFQLFYSYLIQFILQTMVLFKRRSIHCEHITEWDQRNISL